MKDRIESIMADVNNLGLDYPIESREAEIINHIRQMLYLLYVQETILKEDK